MARGIIGKALRGAVQGVNQAMPMIMEDKRHKNNMSLQDRVEQAQARRDARLAEMRQTEQAADHDFQQGLHDDEMGLRRDQLEMNEAQFLKTMENLQLQIDQGKLALEDQQAVRSLFTAYEEAAPEERGKILESIMLRQGDSPIEYHTVQGIDPETLERVQSLVRVNTARGEETTVGVGGGSNSASSGQYEVGKTYQDAEGNQATYLGGDPDDPASWDDGSGGASGLVPAPASGSGEASRDSQPASSEQQRSGANIDSTAAWVRGEVSPEEISTMQGLMEMGKRDELFEFYRKVMARGNQVANNIPQEIHEYLKESAGQRTQNNGLGAFEGLVGSRL